MTIEAPPVPQHGSCDTRQLGAPPPDNHVGKRARVVGATSRPRHHLPHEVCHGGPFAVERERLALL